ncbi:MAG: hypothetical protein DIU76_11170 [Bacillota bacterium]|nr:MAG: hypothetical protein DIU76_11170 [Bacillota bacterium]
MMFQVTAEPPEGGAVPMERLTVYYDGWCPWCVRAAAWCRRLDWLGRLDLRSFRPDRPSLHPGAAAGSRGEAGAVPGGSPPVDAVAMARAEQELLARAHPSGRWYHGFAAVRAIAQRLPLLWPTVPLLAVLQGLGLGPALYRAIARRRPVVLPLPGACPLPRRARCVGTDPAGPCAGGDRRRDADGSAGRAGRRGTRSRPAAGEVGRRDDAPPPADRGVTGSGCSTSCWWRPRSRPTRGTSPARVR